MNPQPNTGGSRALPRRSPFTIIIPIAVVACMIVIVAWSAWPLLRPARIIEIEQAIIAPTSDTTEPEPSAPTTEPARSTRMVQAAGWLEAEPYFVAATALADGVIGEMLVLEGDRVELGQPLARMVDEDASLRLARAKAGEQAAQAAAAIAQARLAAAEQNWQEPYELERAVAGNQARLEELRARLAQLPSLIRTEQALLVKVQEELKSIEAAYANDAASEIEFIAAREAVNAQSARLDATRAQEGIINASIDQTSADLRAAQRALELRIDDRERLDSARAQVQLAQAELAHRSAVRDEANLELDRMTIRAPIAGFVQRRLKAPGDKVLRGMDDPYSAHIAHIYDPSKLQVRVDVPLADASQVFKGQRCEVVVEVLPDRVFQGEVLIVTHEADLQKNTLQIKVRVIDPDPELRPEMLTRVKFLPEQATTESQASTSQSVRVPSTVLDSSTGNERVWIVTERANGRGVLQPISVERVEEQNGWVTLSGDVQPGAIMAADPRACRAGERVRFVAKNGGAS
ncbi:MAG: efflux RND transporter periplasmic adaptor subunit [Phycisphaerales bacterium]|nr:efflux RND transporter periplasmic adaptor subunit [Phycisphaerales bacterium]